MLLRRSTFFTSSSLAENKASRRVTRDLWWGKEGRTVRPDRVMWCPEGQEGILAPGYGLRVWDDWKLQQEGREVGRASKEACTHFLINSQSAWSRPLHKHSLNDVITYAKSKKLSQRRNITKQKQIHGYREQTGDSQWGRESGRDNIEVWD